ncbi:hypothetical protein FALBO_17083 [Fusarium albosuccineum]|uniref:Zn(2)-C6 fungal-type domain-containing protein n=1 Tax=Fusarium albosuccineum TaxID=1237068 RepID=A0A8H4K823_9HYPO|nr:hypothetical protein FALBO_17083 [Fusarium albosuccineum]
MAGTPKLGLRKTLILRTRSGCYTCRTRRRKCDEAKPECANCVRLGFKCDGYGLRLRWPGDPTEPNLPTLGAPVGPGTRRVLMPRATAPAPAPASLAMPGTLQFMPSFPPGSNKRDAFLLHHFVIHASACLGPFSQDGTADLWLHPFLRPAIMSLAAASLYQLHLIHRDDPTGFMIGSAEAQATSASAYKRHAISLYADAVKTLSSAGLESSDAMGLYLAASLLLSLFEWDLGSAVSYFAHLDGADAIVSQAFDNISKLSCGLSILQSWARMHQTRLTRQLPFRPLEQEKSGSSHRKTAALSNQILSGSASLLVLLAEASSLRNRLVLQTCLETDKSGHHSVLQFWREWYSEVFDFPYVAEAHSDEEKELDKSELLDSLGQNETRLRAWRQSLPEAAQPIIPQTEPNEELSYRKSPLPQIIPWTFQDSGAALQYLSYIMGRILSSREILDLYMLGDHVPCSSEALHPLVMNALSVIEALDPETSITHDVYGNGPLWIFGTLATCVPDPRVVAYLLDVAVPRFDRLANCGPLLDAVTSTSQILGCVKLEIEAGRLPFLCDPNVVLTDDFTLDENSTGFIKMAVVGRCYGGLYRELVDVDWAQD